MSARSVKRLGGWRSESRFVWKVAATRFGIACVLAMLALGDSVVAVEDRVSHLGYCERAESRTLGKLKISVAALSTEESATVYGAPLAG
jgi:hypothetical protein